MPQFKFLTVTANNFKNYVTIYPEDTELKVFDDNLGKRVTLPLDEIESYQKALKTYPISRENLLSLWQEELRAFAFYVPHNSLKEKALFNVYATPALNTKRGEVITICRVKTVLNDKKAGNKDYAFIKEWEKKNFQKALLGRKTGDWFFAEYGNKHLEWNRENLRKFKEFVLSTAGNVKI